MNKVESGVRAIYPPTGQSAVCTEERSQYANKQKAAARLRRRAEEKDGNWRCHNALQRGIAGIKFEGIKFRRR